MAGKKKNVGRVVAVQIIRSFIIVAAMLVTGIVSYKLTMTYYEVTADSEERDDILDIVTDVTADSISRNLIYSADPNTKKITGMVIEILNTETGNLDYVTVPASIQVDISTELYQRLFSSGIDIPQIFNVADINLFFKEGASYEYGMLLLEDFLGIDIGYYTCMEPQVFNECFVMEPDTQMYRLNDSLLLKAASADNDMDGFIKSWCDRVSSDLKPKNRMKYSSYYNNVKQELIYYHIFPGQNVNGIFKPDVQACADMYKTILMDKEHTVKQSDAADISSAGLNIKVLNGSGGTNIATATRNIMANDGLSVIKIADNPDGIIENTVIYVSKEGMGRDLLKYFKNASIEVKELEEGIDIMIIVGAADINIGNTD